MHSSRMRTGRSLTICCSVLPGGVCLVWGVCLVPGGVCLVRGGGVCLVLGGCLPGPGGSAWSGGRGSAWSRGVCLVRGEGGLPGPGGACLETPPVDRITDTCKNIILATTSLRPVITNEKNTGKYYEFLV